MFLRQAWRHAISGKLYHGEELVIMTNRRIHVLHLLIVLTTVCACPSPGRAAHTNNIMITGYWPPTNEMIRPFSANPKQNPAGWVGENWEGRGYDIYAFFPEFTNFPNDPIGMGDFEVDYQDTSEDWWRITADIDPVAIITFSRGSNGRLWELETRQRNLFNWVQDYRAPFRPTPNPPDASVPTGFIRPSTLPVQEIVSAVNSANLGLNAFADVTGFGGGFLSEFIAYHGVWYQDLHKLPDDPAQSVAAGHIHVGTNVSTETGRLAAEISLRELITYVDSILIPEPASGWLFAWGLLVAARRRAWM